jgi:hypothetical protein
VTRRSTVANIDPRLIRAIDEYLATTRARMIQRIEKGELSYRGAWVNMSIDELYEAIDEELDDAKVYRAMIQAKEEGSASRGSGWGTE